MRALTLLQPWAYAICAKGKDVENRTWKGTLRVGEDFAIHAGLGWDFSTVGGQLARLKRDEIPRGAVVAVARFGGSWLIREYPYPMSPWATGPVVWKLEDVRVLETPVPCKGRQRLWYVSAHVEAEIRAQLARRR